MSLNNTHCDEEIKRITEDEAVYCGYKICRDGTVISPHGKILSPYFFSYPYSHITLRINGKALKKNRAVLIYNAFSSRNFDYRKNVMVFKDGDPQNASFENIDVISKKEYYHNTSMKHTGKEVFSEKIKRKIREEYRKDDTISMRKLSLKYDCSLSTIQKILETR